MQSKFYTVLKNKLKNVYSSHLDRIEAHTLTSLWMQVELYIKISLLYYIVLQHITAQRWYKENLFCDPKKKTLILSLKC